MRAMVYDAYGGAERLRLADIPAPVPLAGEARLRVLACGVNLSDWENLVGRPAYTRMLGGLRRPRRAVLGSDIVGIVREVRPGRGNASPVAPGDRVACDVAMIRGGFAEEAVAPLSLLAPVPDGLSDETAAALPQPGGIALAGTAGWGAGETVLINGAGGGSRTLALQLAKAARAHATAIDTSSKAAWLAACGAEAAFDYRVYDFAAEASRWDRVLDLFATRGPRRVARSLAPGGTYRAVGGSVGTLLALAAGGPLTASEGRRVGVLAVDASSAVTARALHLAMEGRIAPHIDDVMPLSAVPDALHCIGTGTVKGKLVIRL